MGLTQGASIQFCSWEWLHLFMGWCNPQFQAVQPIFSKGTYWSKGHPDRGSLFLLKGLIRSPSIPSLACTTVITHRDHPLVSVVQPPRTGAARLLVFSLLSHFHVHLFWTPLGCWSSHLCGYKQSHSSLCWCESLFLCVASPGTSFSVHRLKK